MRYRFGDVELSLLSAFAHFQTAQDIGLAELRVELMFPTDEPTRAALAALDRKSSARPVHIGSPVVLYPFVCAVPPAPVLIAPPLERL